MDRLTLRQPPKIGHELPETGTLVRLKLSGIPVPPATDPSGEQSVMTVPTALHQEPFPCRVTRGSGGWCPTVFALEIGEDGQAVRAKHRSQPSGDEAPNLQTSLAARTARLLDYGRTSLDFGFTELTA